jgi:predicted dehydrogenase
MGPYYLTALINMMGPVRRVTGSARITFPQRLITSKQRSGEKIDVSVPTHISGVMDFAGGAIATISTSFDVWAHNSPCIEIFGTEGTLAVPDPNQFGGKVRIRREGDADWSDVPLTHGYVENSRGIGIADMALAIHSGRAHRVQGGLACHVLELMEGFHTASVSDAHYLVESRCERPLPLPVDGLNTETA